MIEQRGTTAAQVRELLYNRSGLLGVSGYESIATSAHYLPAPNGWQPAQVAAVGSCSRCFS